MMDDDDSSPLKKSKPRSMLESMFQKKMKAMEVSSLAGASAAQQSDGEESDGEENDGESSIQSQATAMETDGLGADGIPPEKKDELDEMKYNECLNISIRCLRFLLRGGLHCGAQFSLFEWVFINEGNFVEFFDMLATCNDSSKNADLGNALENFHIQNPEAQKNLVNACVKATAKLIVQDIGDDYFGILVDGSRDKDHEYHLSLYLRYVDKRGLVIERFLGMTSVEDFTPVSCKTAIYSLLKQHSLDPCKIRGQSYNGANHLATNFNSDINSLKSLIMKETHSAYHLHCFSHDLHITLASAAKKCTDCCLVCMRLVDLLDLIRMSCRRNEMLEQANAQKVLEALGTCELGNVKDFLQEIGFQRYDIDCGEYDHYKTLLHFITMFPIIVDVLDLISDVSIVAFKVKAENLLNPFFSFDFVFAAHLMMAILGYTHALNLALQQRDRGIPNVLLLVSVVKDQLRSMRSDDGWEKLLNEVSSFCAKHDIEVLDMNADYTGIERSLCDSKASTNLDYFRDKLYFNVIDLELKVLDNMFDETSMELLSCMACLNPADCFSSFDKQKLRRLAEFYPDEFSAPDLMSLEFQLDIFIADVRSDDRFKNLKDLEELSAKLVETKKHELYSNVYLLLKLMLILPVTTASEERTVYAMYYVKYKLLDNVGDQMLHGSLMTYVERELFAQVLDEDILNCFKTMKITQE